MKHFMQLARQQQWWIQVGLVIFLAFVLRLPMLNGSFWLDEAAQALESTRPWWQQFMIARDFQPPLFHLIVHVLQYVSHAEWWLRLASLIPGLGSVLFCMLTVRLWSTRQAAVISGVLLAFSQMHIFFSQELRPYMLAVFWAMVSWYSLSRWLQAEEKHEVTRWSRVLAVVSALGALSSYVYILWWGAQWAVMMLFRPQRWRLATGSFGVAGLFFLTWWPWFWEQWQVGQALRTQLPGWSEVVSTPFLKAIPLTLGKFMTGVVELDLSFFFAVTVGGWWAVWTIASVWAWWKMPRQKYEQRTGFRMITILIIVSLCIPLVFTLFTPVLAPKRVLFILPLIVASVGILAQFRQWVGVLLVGWFFVWQISGSWLYWTRSELQRENWRALSAEIEHSFSVQNTALVFAFDGPFAPWEWYQQKSWTTFATGTQPPTSHSEVQQALEGIQRYEHILVFEYLRDLTDPEREIDFVLAEWGYDEVGAITYQNIGPVRMWVKRELYANEYK